MNLCAQCALHRRVCCQTAEVLVTEGDRRRIAGATGRSEFWEYRRPADPEYVAEQPEDPRWLAYTVRPDGTRAQLKRVASGDCTFLTPAGCSLPTEVRPLICRLYPHDYTEDGFAGHVTGCPTHLLEPGQTVFEGIGMHCADVGPWRTQLYGELRAGEVFRENQGDLESAPADAAAGPALARGDATAAQSGAAATP